MKNSAINTVKSVAVDTVKFVVYPAHLVAQTTADLLNIGQAQAIKAIDGTPAIQSMFEQQTWTQNKQAAVVGKYMEVKERIEKQRKSNRQQDIDRIKKTLDRLEGVEHITEPTPAITEATTEPQYNPEGFLIKGDNGQVINHTETTVTPAPPKATRKNAMAKAMEKVEARTTPLMTVPAPPVAILEYSL